VRRMRAQRPYVPPEIVAEGASRTPKLTRFIIAKQRRLETLQSEASPVAFDSLNTGSITKPLKAKAPPRGDGLKVRRISHEEEFKLTASKTLFPTSRRLNNNGDTDVHEPKPSVPHTPVTSRPESRRFPRVKGRRDIYELPEDHAFTAAPAREAPSAADQKRSAITLYAEPNTSSFRFPDTPSSPQSQKTRTLEQCLKAARKAPHGIPKEFHNKSQHPAQGASENKISGEVTPEPHELPFRPQQ
jgi:hypothetical protein